MWRYFWSLHCNMWNRLARANKEGLFQILLKNARYLLSEIKKLLSTLNAVLDCIWCQESLVMSLNRTRIMIHKCLLILVLRYHLGIFWKERDKFLILLSRQNLGQFLIGTPILTCILVQIYFLAVITQSCPQRSMRRVCLSRLIRQRFW
jgi:hypothetical protein